MGAVRDWDSKMGVPRKRERERERPLPVRRPH
jgi:hypothetical protein